MTYKDKDLRKAVALLKAKANTESEAFADPKKKEIYNHYMTKVAMAGHSKADGKYIKGIEDELPNTQYTRDEHQEKVVEDILDNWISLSQNSKFHAIFATSSIPEAIQYYRRLKRANPSLKVTALFDPNIDEGSAYASTTAFKQAGLIEIIEDYNARYGQDYGLATHAKFKKDIAARLAHKKPYLRIDSTPEKQIDLLIVVDQMLTGFDSKWLNTLYMDKVLRYENIIQAFSRTNRLYKENEKPFGTIRYYRYPHTMENNIKAAVELYSGNKPVGLFVDKLPDNLAKMNTLYSEIAELFSNAGVHNFEKLPTEKSVCAQFAKLFTKFNEHLEAAKIQGFTWSKLTYTFTKEKHKSDITLLLDENTYLIMVLRYKELSTGSNGGVRIDDVPFEISGHLTEIDTGKIDADYMNSRFEKYLKIFEQNDVSHADTQKILDELHKSFASLTQEEQKFANIFLHDVQRGDVKPEKNKTFREYVTEYIANAKNEQIIELVNVLGSTDGTNITAFNIRLTRMMNAGITAANINEFGRFDDLKSFVDKNKAKAYFEQLEGVSISPFKINMKIDTLLQEFILSGGFDLAKSSNCTI